MNRSRFELIPKDVRAEIISNLNPLDIIYACQVKNFRDVCNDEYFWKRYAEKWKLTKKANTWKNSVFIAALSSISFDYGQDYNVRTGVEEKDGYIVGKSIYHYSDEYKIKWYMDKRKYLIQLDDESIVNDKPDYKFKWDEKYTVYKPYSQYVERISNIIPYDKVILTYPGGRHYEIPKQLPAEKEGLLPPLSSKSYIQIVIPYEEVMIDSQIKKQPLIIDDIFFASRAFLFESNSKIEIIKFKEERDNSLILQVDVTGNKIYF